MGDYGRPKGVAEVKVHGPYEYAKINRHIDEKVGRYVVVR